MTDTSLLAASLDVAEQFAEKAWQLAHELNEEATQKDPLFREIAGKTSAAYDALARARKMLDRND